MAFSRIALATAMLLMTGCSAEDNPAPRQKSQPHSETKRYKYVIEVDTPKGIVTGHSVVSWQTYCGNSIQGRSCSTSEESEAAAVNLPDGTTAYALLTRKGNFQWLCCPNPGSWSNNRTPTFKQYNADKYPDVVIFRDKSDPKSVRIIDSAKEFGNGYRISRIYLERTSDNPTNYLVKRLPWIVGFHGNLAGAPIGSLYGTDPEKLSINSFIEGKNYAH